MSSRIVDTAYFQNQLFPWFENDRAPRTVEELEELLLRKIVRQRISSLNVRYLVSIAANTGSEGFPGMLCGVGPAGGGCLGLAWEDKSSTIDAIVWDLEKAESAANLSITSSGTSFALGLIFPITFVAYTEDEACETLATGLAQILTFDPKGE